MSDDDNDDDNNDDDNDDFVTLYLKRLGMLPHSSHEPDMNNTDADISNIKKKKKKKKKKRLQPNLSTLRLLTERHLQHIPFENIALHCQENKTKTKKSSTRTSASRAKKNDDDERNGQTNVNIETDTDTESDNDNDNPIKLSKGALIQKLLHPSSSRGGCCLELNGLFSMLLKEIGYTSVLLVPCFVYAGKERGHRNKKAKFRVTASHFVLLVTVDAKYMNENENENESGNEGEGENEGEGGSNGEDESKSKDGRDGDRGSDTDTDTDTTDNGACCDQSENEDKRATPYNDHECTGTNTFTHSTHERSNSFIVDVGLGEPSLWPLEYVLDKEQTSPEGMRSRMVWDKLWTDREGKTRQCIVLEWFVGGAGEEKGEEKEKGEEEGEGQWEPRLQWDINDAPLIVLHDKYKEKYNYSHQRSRPPRMRTETEALTLNSFQYVIPMLLNPKSNFAKKLVVCKLTRDAKITLAGRVLKITSPRFIHISQSSESVKVQESNSDSSQSKKVQQQQQQQQRQQQQVVLRDLESEDEVYHVLETVFGIKVNGIKLRLPSLEYSKKSKLWTHL